MRLSKHELEKFERSLKRQGFSKKEIEKKVKLFKDVAHHPRLLDAAILGETHKKKFDWKSCFKKHEKEAYA